MNKKQIEDFDYEVYEDGRIFSLKSNSFLKPCAHRGGYKQVFLRKDGNRYPKYVHRVVLSAFNPTTEALVCNHKNFDRTDNRLENLEWCTQKQNVNHAYDAFRNPLALGRIKEVEILKLFGTKKNSEICKELNISIDSCQNTLRRHFTPKTIRAISCILRDKHPRSSKGQFI